MGQIIKICKIVSICLGIVFIGLGAGFKWGIFPAVVDSMIKSALELKPTNSETWDAWVEPPITPYMKFTFFNVLNVDEVKAGTAKPNVNEIGPFSYREKREKTNILTIEDKISFGSYIHYEYDEEESCEACKIDKEVTVINPVFLIVSDLIEDLGNRVWPTYNINVPNIGTVPISIGDIVNSLLNLIGGSLNTLFLEEGSDMFLTATPDNMIFQGVESPELKAVWTYITNTEREDCLPQQIKTILVEIITTINTLTPNNPNHIDPNIITAEMIENIIQLALGQFEIPPMIDLAAGTFGFFKGQNATKTWWKINSGKYNLEDYNKVLEYNGMSELPASWWDDFGPTPSAEKSGLRGICHDIIGTDGLAYAPNVNKEDKIWLFNDQLCRSIWLTFQKEVDIDGIKTYQYSPDKEVFSMSNPDNYCYCPRVKDCAVEVPENDTWNMKGCDKCKDGILSLQGCQGAPVVMSTPHFLDGDPSLAEAIDGINPVRDAHVTYLNLEPMTGMPLQAHKRIQINVPLFQSKRFELLKNVIESLFPLVWVDEGADIDQENLDKAKGMLVTPFLAVDIGSGVIIGLGGVLILAVIIHSVFKR